MVPITTFTHDVTASHLGRVVRVHAPDVFGTDATEACCGFLARVFCLDEIRSVRVDFRSGTAAVHYRGDIRPATLLEKMADQLRRREPPPMRERLRQLLPPRREAAVTIYRHGASFSSWDVLTSGPGRMRLRHDAVSASSRAREIGKRLVRMPGIRGASWHWFLREWDVEFDSSWDQDSLLAQLDRIVLHSHDALSLREEDLSRMTPLGLARRAINLSLAGVSFSLAVVGVWVPGIPTVPFLLVTSYFLVRSSPGLNERLLRSRTFGPLLRDWQQHRGMRRRVKVISLAVMAVMVIMTVSTAGLSPVMLVVVLVLVALGAYMILRAPTISDAVSSPPLIQLAALPEPA